MLKKRVQKEDGRYLIYYSFPDGLPAAKDEPPPRPAGDEKTEPDRERDV